MQKLKIGVIGASNHFIKRIILPAQSVENIEILAIASRSEVKAQEVAKEFSIPRFYGTYESLLQDEKLDAVYLPLPNHMHADWIKKAADAGKHILCEKPLCMNTAEAEEVLEYTQKRGVILMEAFMYKFHPQWQFARDTVRTNNIGKVSYIHTSFSYNNPAPNNIRNIKEYGGGAMRDIGCYAISVPRFILDKEPVKVISQISQHPEFDTDMLSSAILDFGGARATIHVGTTAQAFQKVDIVGTAGHITIHLPFNTYSDTPAKVTVSTAIGERDVLFGPVDQYGLMFASFANAIINKSDLPVAPDDAILNQKVMDAIFISGESSNWELVD